MINPLKARTSIKCPAVPLSQSYTRKNGTPDRSCPSRGSSLWDTVVNGRGTVDLKILTYAALQTSGEWDNRLGHPKISI